MKVAFFTPTRRHCGIADYARHLLEPLRTHVAVDVIAAEQATSPLSYAILGRAMNDADVAHVQYEHGLFLLDDAPARNFDAFMSAIHVPTVLTMHCLPLSDPRWRRHLEDPGVSFLVHSQHHWQALREHGTRGEVATMFLPPPPRRPPRLSAAAFRAAHGLDGRIVVSIFGFTKAHKGYRIALDALRLLPSASTLLIAGGPQDERDARELSALLQRADILGLASRVAVTGYVPEQDVGAVLEASDVVLAPFTSMTASASVAAALAWERPVVAAALAQHLELHDTFGCLQLCLPEDAEDLARQVERVLADAALRQALREGTRRFREHCSFSELASQLNVLYGRAITAPLQTARGC